jgi:hypothetical protein
MQARSHNVPLSVEALEGRSMMSAVAFGDFNNDGRVDQAVVTNPTTITISLANADGSFTVSAILTTPRNRPAVGIAVDDYNGDGRLDINAYGGSSLNWYTHQWLGNGTGTFGTRSTDIFHFRPHGGW